jgi:glycosyltransferase involved in cell wall biosynthesis
MKQKPRIAVIVRGWPRITETFVAQEIYGLQKAGLKLGLFALRDPKEKKRHAIHNMVDVVPIYLSGNIFVLLLKALSALWYYRGDPGLKILLSAFYKDLRQELSLSRIKRFFQALIFSKNYAKDYDCIYAHFLHTPSTVAYYAHLLTGKPWSFSAHAKDIYTSPKWDLKTKLSSASWGNTCTAYNHNFLSEIAPDFKMHLIYHGIDLDRFVLERDFDENKKGQDQCNPLVFLTIARAVEKKGIDIVLEALAKLPKEIHWRWIHIGGGKLKKEYKKLAKDLGVFEKCEFLNPLTQDEVMPYFEKADLFLLPCRISKSGDRDGLPNVLVEASASAIPSLSTDVSAVKELLADGKTGFLVPSNDVASFASKLQGLCGNPAIRKEIALAAQKKVMQDFSYENAVQKIVGFFEG